MPFVYNEETGAESVMVYNRPVYKCVPGSGIVPGLFDEVRFEADRSLSYADLDHLFELVRYHWADVVGGSPMDDIWCDGDNAYSVSSNFDTVNDSHDGRIYRAIQFVGTLNTRISLGTPEIPPLPDTKVTVWVSEVSKNVSSR